uniref:Uncharacterized protein n=1 Tax=Marseillevirus LCMAC102 TaxID=2506603 RepID=A0A481YTL7_9VIRU|nr:MAG: hypothetical protein LCMAC102_01550 [Marseillevirus LCMAC102]
MASWASIAKEGQKKDDAKQQIIEKDKKEQETEFFTKYDLFYFPIVNNILGVNNETGKIISVSKRMINKWKKYHSK